jgi:formiminotetrahydrofolate cyclodeaminase
MKPKASPIERKPLRDCKLDEFLAALASAAILPGAGAAGGVALALAAACAEKAVAITRKHAANPALEELQEQLASLGKRALELGQRDALQFKQQLKSNDSEAAQELLRTDYTILDACQALDRLLQDNRDLVADNMSGDWKAAHALLHACRVIHNANVREVISDR